MFKKKTSVALELFVASSLLLSCSFCFSGSFDFSGFSETKIANAEETTSEKLSSAQQRLDEANSQMEAIEGEISGVTSKLEETATKIQSKNDEISLKQKDLEKKQDILGKRMASKYRSGESSMLDLLLSSTDFNDLANNWFYIDKIFQSENDMIDDVRVAKTKLEEEEKQLEELQDQQNSELAQLQDKQNSLTEIVASLDQEVQDLIRKQDEEKAAALAAAAAQAQSSEDSWSGGSYASGPIPPAADSSKGQAIVNACFTTPSTGQNYCAAWVTNVYRNAGVSPVPTGNANDMFYAYCHSSDKSELQAGMLVADASHNGTGYAGLRWGHVGIYLGNGEVISNIGYIYRQSLDSFIAFYGGITGVRWGWG